MKHALASLTIGACLLLPSASVVFAAGQPGTSAGVNCGGAPVGIGSGGVAGAVYAGSTGTPSAMHAASANAVSQYDVACLQVTTHATTHQPP